MQSFRTPLGVIPIAGDDEPPFQPERGFRLTIYRHSRSPYFFELSLPVPELFNVFRSLTEHLSDMVYPVMERPPEEGEDLPAWPQGRYASLGRYMKRHDIMALFQKHAFQIQNDGMLGAGLAGRNDDTGFFREVFIDEHKTLRVITEDPAEIKDILRENDIPFIPDLTLLGERAHAHRSLIVFDDLREMFSEPELAYDQVFTDIARALGMPAKQNLSL